MLHLVVAGAELGDDDPFIPCWYRLLWLSIPKYTISLRDPRQPIAPLYTHSSTHSNDITTISSHPAVSSPLILSDGLLTISNPTETDEDETMLHVRSWGTSRLVLLKCQRIVIWAASDMETFSLVGRCLPSCLRPIHCRLWFSQARPVAVIRHPLPFSPHSLGLE